MTIVRLYQMVFFGFSKLVQGGILYMKSDAVTDTIICDKPLSEPMLTRFTDTYMQH